jgi:acyl dehydratase
MTLPVHVSPSCYDEFVPGTVISHAQRRVVTEADNLLYSRLSGHEHPFFFAYARHNAGPVPVNPMLVLGFVGGLVVRATSQSAIANLGWESIAFPERAYVGDELSALTEIVGKRLSRGDPSRGLVTIRTFGLNQHDKVVLIAKRTFLVSCERG